MHNRDEEHKPFLAGLGNFVDVVVKQTQDTVQGAMIGVEKVLNAGAPKVDIEELIARIQELQITYLNALGIQFLSALVVIGIFKIFELFHHFDNVVFIVQLVLLLIFIMSIMIARFGGDQVHEKPKNVILFIFHGVIRIFWLAYLTISVEWIKFDLLILIITVDIVLINVFARLDAQAKIQNCYRLRDQPWRVGFIWIFEVLAVGLILGIEDFQQVFIWGIILFFTYLFILFSTQMVEFRKFFRQNNNDWFLSVAIFDSDILVPCQFLAHHLGCSTDRTIFSN